MDTGTLLQVGTAGPKYSEKFPGASINLLVLATLMLPKP
jgi:hypothetical protein